MKNIKTPYKNIYQVLRLNRFIVIVAVIGTVISTGLSSVIIYKIYQSSVNSAFAIGTDGSVIPLKWVTQRENIEVEALSHLELFHSYFYNIDASNYKKNLEKALLLGNSSVDNVYRQKKADGVYNRLLQYSLVEKVISIDSKIDIQKEPYEFRTITIFEINRGTVTDRYELTTTGNLISVDRNYPKNPHGLLITNYFENTLKKVDQSTTGKTGN